MKPFSVGEQVVVRHGSRGGQQALVVEKQPADVYKVRFPDGALLYYSGAGLLVALATPQSSPPVPTTRDVPSRN